MPDGAAAKHRRTANPRKEPGAARADIIAAASAEFAEHGLSGASVNDIAARTRTSKPMIYYYFESKEGLYTAVMEAAYARIRDMEQTLDLEAKPVLVAMRHLVEATFDYHAENPNFVRLISVENIHDARHIATSSTIANRNAEIIGVVRRLLLRGEEEGLFRPGMDPIEVHLLISSLSFHPVSNRHSWRVLFGVDLQAPELLARRRTHAVDAVLGFLRVDQPGP